MPSNAVLLKKKWPFRSVERQTRSHFGGEPSLPPEAQWPEVVSRGRLQPTHFLAQIDCAELPSIPERNLLPEEGLLAFYLLVGDDLDGPVCAVRWQRESFGDLKPVRPPSELEAILTRTHSKDSAWIQQQQFGFVPIELVALETFRSPVSDLPGRPNREAVQKCHEAMPAFEAATQACLRAALGPKPELPFPGNLLDDPQWPETFAHARAWTHDAIRLTERGLVSLRDRLSKLTQDDLKQVLSRRIFEQEELLAALGSFSLKLQDGQETRGIDSHLRASIREWKPRLDMVIHAGVAQANDISKNLMHQFAEDEVPLSPQSVLSVRRLSLTDLYNSNQLLGYPLEGQNASAAIALDHLKRQNWASDSECVEDVCLLAQFDTCYGGVGFLFGDCDKVYFYGLKRHFESRQYDKVVTVLGC
jgi:hypothetical protein